jgi:hypothetical protein
MGNPTFFPIDPELLEGTARALVHLSAPEVEPALAEAARQHAEALSARHSDMPRFVMEYNGRHFAQQAARRARQIILRLG